MLPAAAIRPVPGIALALAGLISADPADADINLTGRLDLGFRVYEQDGRWSGQGPAGSYGFVGGQINAGATLGPGTLTFQVTGVADDALDRTFLNLQKAHYSQSFDGWDLLIGYAIEDWGVSAGRSIVNVLNAQDQADRLGFGGLIGTPMVAVNAYTGIGTFSAYAAFGGVNAHFGGRATRMRLPLAFDTDLTAYESDDGPDLALRWSDSFTLGPGALDLSLSAYHGTSREAVALPGCRGGYGLVTAQICRQINTAVQTLYEAGTPLPATAPGLANFLLANFPAEALDIANGGLGALIPYYQEIGQAGLTAVYAWGDTQVRFEGIRRQTTFEDFSAYIVGGDHTFYGLGGGDGALTLALEYHFDDRSLRQSGSLFENDLFLGLSYFANDRNNTQAAFGLFHDLESEAEIYSLTLSRRIGESLRISFDLTHVESRGGTDPLSFIDGDSFVELTLSTYF